MNAKGEQEQQEQQTERQQAAEAAEAGTYGGQAEGAAEAVETETAEAAGTNEQAEATSEQLLIEALRKEADDNQQRFLRAQADFDNFRRRSRLEKEEFAKYASAKLIEQLLPIFDNFERALQSSKEAKDFDSLVKGIEMTFRQMEQVMAQEGLSVMQAVGQPFNPEHHQAIMQVESDEHEEGIIVEEIQKGYMLKEKVLRPAMVKVSM
ncbi:MAG: nucleotide exchange factor GrpE [Paenibacillaceae bacterium]|nr:nucleotide exchange factor GrpE [Paenibacillaceae bacterium]